VRLGLAVDLDEALSAEALLVMRECRPLLAQGLALLVQQAQCLHFGSSPRGCVMARSYGPLEGAVAPLGYKSGCLSGWTCACSAREFC
jgi:hypothetical protein